MTDEAIEPNEAGNEDIELSMFHRGTRDSEIVRDPISQHPPEMVVREVDYDIRNGKNLTFFYSRVWAPKAVNRADFERYVKLFAAGQIPADFVEATTAMHAGYPSQLSISNLKKRYHVFLLSARRDWQFAQEGAPITVGRGLAGTAFFEGRRVTRGGTFQIEGPGGTLDYCRVAYLAALNREPTNTTPYSYAFNLNIDLYDNNDGLGTTTPIVIDPDIRYPGGSTITDPPE